MTAGPESIRTAATTGTTSPGSRNPRVVQLVASLRVGGAERVAATLARALAAEAWPVAVVSMYGPSGSPLEAELQVARVPIVFLGKRPGPDFRMVTRLARALRELRPDVLHTHGGVSRYAALSRLLASRPPVVHTVHNLATHEADTAGMVLNFVSFRGGVSPVAIGDAVAASIRRVYRVNPRCTIPNGIAVQAFTRASEGERGAIRAELGLPANAPVFLNVGRLMPQKNHALLVDVFASERLAQLGARLLVAGDGELRGDLERRIRERGLTTSVILLGKRNDVPRLLSAVDGFVLSSSWEGNPLSVMEAMAAGVPIVATAVGCVPELVPPESGWLVPPGDRAALEAALCALAEDPGRSRAMGIAAARLARERFDVRRMIDAYEALYREVAGSATWSPASRAGDGS